MSVKRTRHLELLFSLLVGKLHVSMKRTQQGLELVSSLVGKLRVNEEENTALRVSYLVHWWGEREEEAEHELS